MRDETRKYAGNVIIKFEQFHTFILIYVGALKLYANVLLAGVLPKPKIKRDETDQSTNCFNILLTIYAYHTNPSFIQFNTFLVGAYKNCEPIFSSCFVVCRLHRPL